MTNEEKLKLAERIIEFVQDSYVNEDVPQLVGELNKPQGIKGFKLADVGHPVFELKDRYIIYMESEFEEKIAKPFEPVVFKPINVAVPYYKETLSPFINFKNK